jgi:hypothetical protein
VIRKHAVGYTPVQAVAASGHLPHCASANPSGETTKRIVFFACHVMDSEDEADVSDEERRFHSVESCILRAKAASIETNTLEGTVSKHLAGCDAVFLKRIRK